MNELYKLAALYKLEPDVETAVLLSEIHLLSDTCTGNMHIFCMSVPYILWKELIIKALQALETWAP